MTLRRLAPALLLAAPCAWSQQTIGLHPGQTLTKSIRVVDGERVYMPPGPPSVCLTVKGDNLTLDFNDAYIRGAKDVYHDRDKFDGVGILLDGCHNVTIKNAHFQGFRFNVKIVNSENINLVNCDTSFSRSIRMATPDGDPVDTFLNLRDNQVWRSYGAGIWLENSRSCSAQGCTGTGAQNGVVLVDSDQNSIIDSDFSFNGGWGIALSHSNGNVVAWNHADFVNRPWGGGWGGDSAAIAIANNSDGNYIVGNSITHSGDGFFLSNRNDIGSINPATGFYDPLGGSDHNVVAYNDGSWSPNNAFEGTFSDGNIYFENISNFSGFGYWLGFSTNSLLLNNTITDNERGGIAIEQGKGNKIEGNKLERNGSFGINLWGNAEKARTPFPSTANDIAGNTISDSPKAYSLQGSTDTAISGNKILRAATPDASTSERTIGDALHRFQATPDWTKLQEILAFKPRDYKMYSESRLPKGTLWVQAAEFAPRDYRGALAAQRQVDPGMIELYLLESGVKVTAPDWAAYEDTPDNPFMVRITANPGDNGVGGERPITIVLTSKDGKHKQVVKALLRTAQWTVKYFEWRGLTFDDTQGWSQLFSSEPKKVEESRSLGGNWNGKPPTDGIRSEFFAILAGAKIQVPPGKYVFHTLSDDGVRLYVDDRLLIDRWNHHGATADNVPMSLDGGVHSVRVEYCQEDGGSVLQVSWTKQ